MAESDLEDSTKHPFNPKEWIGNGRQLPTSPNDIPQGLANYFHSLKDIPNEVMDQYYPKSGLNIKSFLEYNPPKCTFGLLKSPAMDCFRLEEPHAAATQDTEFAGRSLPPLKFVEALNEHF